MQIAALISFIISIFTFFLVMRYNLHMFQLNGYKNNEHVNWLKKNYKKQMLLIMSLVLGILATFKNTLPVLIILIIVSLLICKYYTYLKKQNTKKKLVYTKRVIRMIISNVIVNFIIVLYIYIWRGIGVLPGGIAILVSMQFFFLLIVNIINKPIEKCVNNYFINDAKKMLKQSPNLKVIGVTGSYGKTSVKFYLQTLLQGHFNVLVTPESYNTPMGVVKTIRESLKSTHEIFVCEMGARYVGDIKEVCDIVNPDYGVITSVGPQHLETFINMDNITNTKFELAEAVPSDGMIFLNGDNPYIVEKSKKYSNKIFYSSQSGTNGYYAEDIKVSQLGTEFTVVSPEGERETFHMKLIGEHNVINVLGAIVVANSFGIKLSDLKVQVRRIRPVEHRMQILEKGLVTIIDDSYNSNPVGSKVAVETLALFEGVRILITPGMVELGKEEENFNYKFGTYAAKCCDYIILVGKKHTEPIKKGILDSDFPKEKCWVYDKLEDALACAYNIKEERHKYILLENDLPDNY